jgi:hypothetical protein
MPSAFDSIYASARATLFSQHGRDDVTHTPPGSVVATPCIAIVGPVSDELEQDHDGHTLLRVRFVQASTVAGEGGPATVPVRGSIFTVDGEAWTVQLAPSIAPGTVRCKCVRPLLLESAMRGNREM